MLALPVAGYAAGISSAPPATTKTTTECKGAQVFDEKTKTCVDARDSRLDDDARFDAARELAYRDRPRDALAVLSTMSEQDSDRVLTYLGFATRKSGDMEAAMAFYDRALKQNPDNLMARSYRGQAYILQGEATLASAELSQIRQRGGRGTWPEYALRAAIETGRFSGY